VIQGFSNLKRNLSYGSGAVFDANRPRYANGKLYFQNKLGMFYIMDVSNGVDNLTVLGSLDMSGLSPVGFVLNGNTVYFLASDSRIGVVDVTNSASPNWVTTVATSDSGQNPWYGAFVYENYLYVNCSYGGGANSGKVFIYDVSNPQSPVESSTFTFPTSEPQWENLTNWGGGHLGNVCIKGNYLYVNSYFSEYILGQGLGEIYVVDISDKQNPTLVTTVNVPQGNDEVADFEPWTLLVKGNYLYINDDRNIAYYDISNPASPTYIGMVASTSGDTESAIIIGDSIFWTCNATQELLAWDISSGPPVEVGQFSVGFPCSNGLGYDSTNKIVYFMANGYLAQASYTTN
jgi:hypothetical protein